jgi:hypothetical protein
MKTIPIKIRIGSSSVNAKKYLVADMQMCEMEEFTSVLTVFSGGLNIILGEKSSGD